MLSLYLTFIDEEEDKKLFEDVVLSFRKQLIAYVMSMHNNREDAEDIVHDVFLCMASKHMDVVRKLRCKTDMRNYLMRAAKNTMLNMFKKKDHEQFSLDTVTEYNIDDYRELSDNTFLETIYTKIEYNDLVKAIVSLPEKYRDVLYYHFVLDLTVAKTAKILGRSMATTKKQLVVGKKELLKLCNKGVDKNGND